jgi:hypothetical protein
MAYPPSHFNNLPVEVSSLIICLALQSSSWVLDHGPQQEPASWTRDRGSFSLVCRHWAQIVAYSRNVWGNELVINCPGQSVLVQAQRVFHWISNISRSGKQTKTVYWVIDDNPSESPIDCGAIEDAVRMIQPSLSALESLAVKFNSHAANEAVDFFSALFRSEFRSNNRLMTLELVVGNNFVINYGSYRPIQLPADALSNLTTLSVAGSILLQPMEGIPLRSIIHLDIGPMVASYALFWLRLCPNIIFARIILYKPDLGPWERQPSELEVEDAYLDKIKILNFSGDREQIDIVVDHLVLHPELQPRLYVNTS